MQSSNAHHTSTMPGPTLFPEDLRPFCNSNRGIPLAEPLAILWVQSAVVLQEQLKDTLEDSGNNAKEVPAHKAPSAGYKIVLATRTTKRSA